MVLPKRKNILPVIENKMGKDNELLQMVKVEDVAGLTRLLQKYKTTKPSKFNIITIIIGFGENKSSVKREEKKKNFRIIRTNCSINLKFQRLNLLL